MRAEERGQVVQGDIAVAVFEVDGAGPAARLEVALDRDDHVAGDARVDRNVIDDPQAITIGGLDLECAA